MPTLTCLVALCAGATTTGHAHADVIESCAHAAEASQELRDADRLVEAREQLRVCARDVCPGVVRVDCRKWLTEVDQLVPSVIIFANDQDGRPVHPVTLRIDGRLIERALDGKPLELDPGAHQFTFEADGYVTSTREVVIRTSEKNRDLRVMLTPTSTRPAPTPTPSSSGVPTLSYVLYGVGVAALGTGAYLGIDARSDVSHLRETCAPSCSTSDVDHVRTQLMIADIALGVGVVSVGAATWLLLSDGDDEPGPLSVGAGPGGLSASWQQTF